MSSRELQQSLQLPCQMVAVCMEPGECLPPSRKCVSMGGRNGSAQKETCVTRMVRGPI
ncbi:hypothetical protein AB1Y20_019197, partial [Prymnesium parvum]